MTNNAEKQPNGRFSGAPETLAITDHLSMRAVRSTDDGVGFALLDSNRPYLRATLDFVDTFTREAATTAFRNMEADWHTGKRITYFIEADSQPIGTIGLHPLETPDPTRCEMGFWVAEAMAGKDIATQAARTLLQEAFGYLGFSAVELHIKPDNSPSLRVAEKLGAHLIDEQEEVWSGVTSSYQIWEVTNDNPN